jgi:hypothetical protein
VFLKEAGEVTWWGAKIVWRIIESFFFKLLEKFVPS